MYGLYLKNSIHFNLCDFFLHFHYFYLETITYSEETAVRRSPSNEKEIKISDLATKVRNIHYFTYHTLFYWKNILW